MFGALVSQFSSEKNLMQVTLPRLFFTSALKARWNDEEFPVTRVQLEDLQDKSAKPNASHQSVYKSHSTVSTSSKACQAVKEMTKKRRLVSSEK